MKLPQPLLESPYFLFEDVNELITALGKDLTTDDAQEIFRLANLALPPLISHDALAVMFGINPGLVWSLENRTHKYYRQFLIPKGRGKSTRVINAPRIVLKAIQKWISLHLQKSFVVPQHVYGFVPGRSHIGAANAHCGATWLYSIDIKNFFPTCPLQEVVNGLGRLGYGAEASSLIAHLCCLNGFLAQGAPTSPVLSNIVFSDMDEQLLEIARRHNAALTRYADDIVFSGKSDFPDGLVESIKSKFSHSPWTLSDEKEEKTLLPKRLKVHGLLVHGNSVRLTKGYRNRIRAFNHLVSKGKMAEKDLPRVIGHLQFAKQISGFAR